MISSQTLVQVSESGLEKKASDLLIGETLFSPIGGHHIEIVDILTREISRDTALRRKILPVRIPKNSIRPNYPASDLVLSPHQEVMIGRINSHSGVTEMQTNSANDLKESAEEGNTGNTVRYTLIFTDKRVFMRCSGILISSYVLEDII